MEEYLRNEEVPQVEVVVFSKGLINPSEGNSYMTMAAGIQHPFSRGSVVSTLLELSCKAFEGTD